MKKTSFIAWDEPCKTTDLCSYLGPIFANCRLLGCSPSDADMRSSPARMALVILMMCVMLSSGYVYAYSAFGIPHTTTANAIVYMSGVVLAIITTFLVVTFSVLQRHKLKKTIDSIRIIDLKLLTMGVLYKYDKNEILVEVFLRLIFKVIMVVFDWIAYEQSFGVISGPCLIFSLYYSYFVLYNLQNQYTALMKVLYRHFSMVSERSFGHARNKDVIQRFLETHNELCEISELVNDWFSPQILLICTLVFLVSTLNLNAMVMALISFLDPLPPQISIFISCTFWVTARAYETWEILDACWKTENKAEELGRKLSKLMIDDETKNDNELLEIHFHVQPKLSFTASGFFKLNNSLFQSMLASATTYIVIIIQVQPQMQGVVCTSLEPKAMFNFSTPMPT